MTGSEQKTIILDILHDVADDEAEALLSFAAHVGFDFAALRSMQDFTAAWLGHYRVRQGRYDVERAAYDLATWPPIAQRIEEIRIATAKSPDNL